MRQAICYYPQITAQMKYFRTRKDLDDLKTWRVLEKNEISQETMKAQFVRDVKTTLINVRAGKVSSIWCWFLPLGGV
jgi:hypothetical protein